MSLINVECWVVVIETADSTSNTIVIFVVDFAAQLKNASNLISCITTKQFEKIVDFIMQKSF